MNTLDSKLNRAVRFSLAAGLIMLALHPVKWLVGTWISPDYDSRGLWIFLAVAGLFLWSATSPRLSRPAPPRVAWIILLFTALVRLIGGVLAVNTIGALALALDVLALGLLAGLPRRRRAVSPWWLALLFILSLPVERIVQRTLGFGLQLLSADGAGTLLSVFWEVRVEGARIILAGQDVLVDLPCSGARGLMLLFVLLAALMAVVRPGPGRGLAAAAAALAAALAGNIVRIALLAMGLAFPDAIGGLNVMAQPWHDLAGLISLALAAAPLLVLANRWRNGPVRTAEAAQQGPDKRPGRRQACASESVYRPSRPALAAGLLFLPAALFIINLPARPVDVSRADPAAPLVLPLWLEGHFQEPTPLSSREEIYFTRFGGAAAKGVYGPNGLLLVRTSSPLRHLHAPDECLRGLGFKVDYQGLDRRLVPTAVYKAVGPDGRAWRVGVTFRSSSGRLAASVTEAVWHWLGTPETWTTVQRLSPWADSAVPARAWDEAVWAALETGWQ